MFPAKLLFHRLLVAVAARQKTKPSTGGTNTKANEINVDF
jgi:hypothetical protein